ncbi:hypothetical protein ACF3DV_25865 [Chlorogloeopsis fritschii PCC 9212]|uniref:hypothetical protein n=1 Tax=Chlorogloeopsis fritschii TaxID=1124 RepID=UPI00370DB7F4
MMINKLAKFKLVATVLAITGFLAPQSALGLGRFSGRAINQQDYLLFGIDTSIPLCHGKFYDAIPNSVYVNRLGLNPEDETVILFNPGNLKVSLVYETENPTLFEILNAKQSSFTGKFVEKAVKYEARLEDDTDPTNITYINFAFYAPYVHPFANLNSLSAINKSNLTPFLDENGQVSLPQEISNLQGELPLDKTDSLFSVFSFTPESNDETKPKRKTLVICRLQPGKKNR